MEKFQTNMLHDVFTMIIPTVIIFAVVNFTINAIIISSVFEMSLLDGFKFVFNAITGE